MQPVTVAEVADELYGLTPAEFTAARDERAREVRASGQRDEAAAIRKLGRPTASAWLVNQLSRAAPDHVGRLTEVGEALEEAQRTLAGDRLRELSGQRRQVVTELLAQVADVASAAGQPASAAVLGEVRATLEAALADAGARSAVLSGRLTKAISYAGIGEVDLTAALALPANQVSGRPGGRAARPAARDQRAPRPDAPTAATASRSAAQRSADAIGAAAAAVTEAERAQSAAEQQLASVTEQRQFLQRRISHLERELRQAKEEDAQLAEEARQAHRDRDAAARALESGRRSVATAHRAPKRKRTPKK